MGEGRPGIQGCAPAGRGTADGGRRTANASMADYERERAGDVAWRDVSRTDGMSRGRRPIGKRSKWWGHTGFLLRFRRESGGEVRS